LIHDLLSLSRVEINEHVLPREVVDLPDLLSGVVETLEIRASQRSMSIEFECPANLPPLYGDVDQLTRVFHNLIDNAIKYARERTAVRVTVSLADGLPGISQRLVSVAVSDQGEGIAAIHLPRLTERFYRIDKGRSRRLGGTGLGLAIVKHIVSRHRGRLKIESTVGVGSTFTVYLPLVEGVVVSESHAISRASGAVRAPPSGLS
jgi:two-component system phosphate regulon sensor histidine kinase PhoR